MGDYSRTTRECTLDSMRPALAAAIRARIEKYDLEDAEASTLICCETVSTKQKKGLFRSQTEVVLTGICLTSQWLIWAAGKENETPSVLAAKLRDIRVEDYEKSSMYAMIQDTGLNIFGLHTDAHGLGSTFIGLGSEPVAQRFRDLLKEAVAKA